MRLVRVSWPAKLLAFSLTLLLNECVAQEGLEGKPRKVSKSDEEWAKQLTRSQFLVCRRKATEPPFSGQYLHVKGKGTFTCVCCGAELFSSRTKFDSGTGWPSFSSPISPESVDTEIDLRGGEERVEVLCNTCGAHLGHVFTDGPPPTGLRYCMNSVALKLVRVSNASQTSPKPKGRSASRKGESLRPSETGKSSGESPGHTKDQETVAKP